MKTVSCIFLIISIFVVSKQFERNLKLFFYDKELPAMGSNNESVVLPVLDCLDNPTVAAPYTNLFSMSKKTKSVSDTSVCGAGTFLHKYFNVLPQCLTFEEAFARASLDYYNLFQEFPFASYSQFKTVIYG